MASPADQHPSERRFGDFAVGREIGRGSMGVVYEARQVSLNRKVALKVLTGELGLTSRGVERFHREAEAAAKLHHSNIVPIYAIGEQDGTWFYTMELIEGASLDHVVRHLRQERERTAKGLSPAAEPATPPGLAATTAPVATTAASSSGDGSSSALSSGSGYFNNVARMIADVADALDHAHKQGVIHRDIKPSNLLLCADGRLSVNDFGLARMLEKPGVTLTGEFVGTPAYMSPEQITAGRVPLDHRTDIYSLGATLYELLTLQRPFRGDGRDQVLAQILQKEPVPPRRIDKKVPIDLETICLKAMDKDPDRRYQSAREMAEDLRRHVQRFAIQARRVGPLARAVKWMRRHPAATLLVASLLIAVPAAAFFAYRANVAERRRLAEQRQNAIDTAHLAAMSGDFDKASESLGEAERLGVSTFEAQMLRGQIEFHAGKMDNAVEHFKQAAALEPASVAAHAMLGSAYQEAGKYVLADKARDQARSLAPATAEDYLFLGRSEALYHPEKAMQLLETAVQKRPSVIARLIRADALMNLARDRGDANMAQQAAQEADLVNHLLGDNPLALRIALEARTIAIYAYRLSDPQSQLGATIAQARKDARRLKGLPQYAFALLIRWYFLRALGEQNDLLGEMEKSKAAGVTELYVLTLYRLGKFDDARAAMARDKDVGAMFVCLVLREFPDGPEEILKSYRKEAAGPSRSNWELLTNQMALLLLGKLTESRAICKGYRQKSLASPMKSAEFRRALEYLSGAGTLSAEAYLKAAGESRIDRTNVHYFVGLTCLAEGKRKAARDHFRKAVETGGFSFDHFELSWALLGRMEQDQSWPRWILNSE
jgi:tetratricopeptide (TPR) repeat protein